MTKRQCDRRDAIEKSGNTQMLVGIQLISRNSNLCCHIVWIAFVSVVES
jgi:hypothetical protein